MVEGEHDQGVHLPFARATCATSGGLPRSVVRDFEEYLRCGILEHGLVHLACARCGHAIVVGFSCKRRGFCPSCLGRRTSDIAAHLVDEGVPEVPIRPWVCSLPWPLRYAFAFDRALCAEVLTALTPRLRRSSSSVDFVQQRWTSSTRNITALTRSLRWRAKRLLGLRSVGDALVGALTMIQRSDSALGVNPHFHTLALDGVYLRDEQGALAFHPLPTPSAEGVAELALETHARIVRVLARHGDRSPRAPARRADDGHPAHARHARVPRVRGRHDRARRVGRALRARAGRRRRVSRRSAPLLRERRQRVAIGYSVVLLVSPLAVTP